MFLLSSQRLTAVGQSRVPGVQAWSVPDLIPADPSVGTPSSSGSSFTRSRGIDREEPCFVTKSSCYTHKIVHWVNAIPNDAAAKEAVEELLKDLGVVHAVFFLDHTVNLSHLDCTLHAGLDTYGFFAITGSADTLQQLIDMVKAENDQRQEFFDKHAKNKIRYLDFEHPAFLNPRYELVALRPQHMLPDGKVLVAYSRDANGHVKSYKTYVPAPDNTLRESPGDNNCERFPPFSFDYPRKLLGLNPFLVILNAEIKFRRYLRQTTPPPLVLIDEVNNLIKLTTELVELLYWKPVVREGTHAAHLFASRSSGENWSQSSSEAADEEMGSRAPPSGAIRKPGPGATLEERMEYGQYLLSGRDLPFTDDDQCLLDELAQADIERDRQLHGVVVQEGGIEAWRSGVSQCAE